MTRKAGNITWHHGLVPAEERQRRLGQRGCVVWLTGLSGSGKSTIARALEARLMAAGRVAYVLDGDNIRHGLNSDLGFSPEDRDENIRRIGEVARLFADAGILVMTAFISPYIKDRDQARSLLPEGRFIEIYCACSLDKCEERDPKGLYQKARSGEIKEFTGISAPYEAPQNPELVIQTDTLTLHESADEIIRFLEEKGLVPASGNE